MKKFEYKIFSFHSLAKDEIDSKTLRQLNELGEQGWELVSVAPAKKYSVFDDPEYLLTAFFKREVIR